MHIEVVLDMSALTDAQLSAELLRRQKAREEAAHRARITRNTQIFALRDQLLQVTEHVGDGCSDEHTYNRLPLAHSGGQVPCGRCFLVDLTEEDLDRVTLDINLDVRVLPGHPDYEG